jgi:thioredoxin 1
MTRTMKKIIALTAIFTFLLITIIITAKPGNKKKEIENNITVVQLTNDTFKKMVFNYEQNKEWKYEGTRPAIIDFYATWCGPCTRLSPLVEEIAKEYTGKIAVYKVDTDKERALSQNLGISGLPTLLFIPVKGKPQASIGLISKETMVKAINTVLMIE